MPNSVSPPLMLFRGDSTRIHWRASWHHSHRDSRVPLYNTTKLLTWAVVVTVANILSLCCCSHYCHVVGSAYFFILGATVIWTFFDDNKSVYRQFKVDGVQGLQIFFSIQTCNKEIRYLKANVFSMNYFDRPLFSVWPYVPKRFGL